MKVQERCITVNLMIGKWGASKRDKDATEETIANKKAKDGSGSFQKRLLKTHAMASINAVISKARAAHLMLSLPWSDSGPRIMATVGFPHYTKVMNGFQQEFKTVVEKFIKKEYSPARKEAEEFLGEMFNADDYPDEATLRSKFYMDIEINPVITKGDFRAKMSDSDAKAIANDIERRFNERVKNGTKVAYTQIVELTSEIAKRLESYKPRVGLQSAQGKFQDSMFEKLEKLAETLPALNITGDPELDKLSKDLVKSLCQYNAEELRKDDNARHRVAKKADDLTKKLSAFI